MLWGFPSFLPCAAMVLAATSRQIRTARLRRLARKLIIGKFAVEMPAYPAAIPAKPFPSTALVLSPSKSPASPMGVVMKTAKQLPVIQGAEDPVVAPAHPTSTT